MNYPWAVVGAKVVCVDGWVNNYKLNVDIKGPSTGEILTIREIVPIWGRLDRFALRFEEYKNPKSEFSRGVSEQAFWIERFKPLEKKKLPDVLTSLLTNPRKVIMKDQFDKQGTDA